MAASLLALSHEGSARSQQRNSSPFVGEHKDARTIAHGNGRVTAKMQAKPTSYNKYESFIERKDLFKNRKAAAKAANNKQSAFSEFLFGKQEPTKASKYSGSSHRLGADITQELVNLEGTMWTGPMYMGGTTLMDVVYDTGSDWLVVEGSNCSNCEGNTYNVDDSEGTPVQINAEQSERNYGSASLKGYEYTDKVCITLGTCIEDFEFYLIDEQVGIAEPIDGILGLSRNNAFHINLEAGNTTGPLYVEGLAAAGVIDADKFSFYFQQPSEQSWIDLGEPDLTHKKDGTEFVTTQLIDPDFFWGQYNTGVAIGTIDNAFAYEDSSDYPIFVENNSIYAIIDTGSTALMISSMYYEALIYAIFEEAADDDWNFTQGVVECSCNANLPSVWFQFDGAWIEARAVDYIFDYYGQDDRCILFIMPVNMPMHILGMPVFVDYYSVHEPVTGQVHWAPHTNSPKDTVVSGPIPTGKFLALGEVQQSSGGVADLLQYAVASAVCYLAIYYWQTSLYVYLAHADQGFEDYQVSGLSGAYFLTVALVYYWGIDPLGSKLIGSFSATASASVRVQAASPTAMTMATWAALIFTAGYLLARVYKAKKVTVVAQKKVTVSVEESKASDLNELLSEHLNQLQ